MPMRNDHKLWDGRLADCHDGFGAVAERAELRASETATPPAMGTTSPLTTVGPTGIPLGSVEINPGGLSTTISISPTTTAGSVSPLSSTAAPGCSTAPTSESAMTALDSTLSNFDGGGVSGTTNATAGATSSAVGGTSSANPTLSTVLSSVRPHRARLPALPAISPTATDRPRTCRDSARVGGNRQFGRKPDTRPADDHEFGSGNQSAGGAPNTQPAHVRNNVGNKSADGLYHRYALRRSTDATGSNGASTPRYVTDVQRHVDLGC